MTKAERQAILSKPYDGPMHPSERNGQPHANGKAAAKPAKSKATAERFETINAFIDFAMGELTRAEIATWMVLYRDTRNGRVQTSMEQIANRTKASKRQTVRAIEVLLERGLIARIYTGGINRGASIYRVLGTPKLEGRLVTPMSPVTSDTHVTSAGDISCISLVTPMSPTP